MASVSDACEIQWLDQLVLQRQDLAKCVALIGWSDDRDPRMKVTVFCSKADFRTIGSWTELIAWSESLKESRAIYNVATTSERLRYGCLIEYIVITDVVCRV